MDNFYHDPDQINKAMMKHAARLGGKILMKGVKSAAASYLPAVIAPLAAMLIVVILFTAVYAVVFIMPRQIIEEKTEAAKGRVVSLFSFVDDPEQEWVKKYDSLLEKKYEELTASWDDGLTEFQKEQAEQYKLSWAVLAAVDRVIGDPSVNLEARGKILMPQPERHYEILKPRFKWKESTITRVIEWKEKDCDPVYDENGNVIGKDCDIVHRKKVEKETVKLLVSADTYEARYDYEYETVTTVEGEAALNSKKVTTTREVVKYITESGPYYSRLLEILADYGMGNKSSLEFILELAAAYDEDYEYSLEDRWVGLNSLAVDFSKSYYHGTLGEVAWPLPRRYTKISSGFGWRLDPFTHRRRFHTGLDIPAPRKTLVCAFADGIVRFAGSAGAYGKCVLVEHGDGYYTMYAHLSGIGVEEGEEVKTGDILGLVGSTGRSTGPHLHFEVRKIDKDRIKYKNPAVFFTH